MRRAAPAAISPKLLRHFAAATIALTTCLAIFAEGSVPDPVKERVEKSAAQAQVKVNLAKSNKQMRNGLYVRKDSPPVPVDVGESRSDDTGSDGGSGSDYVQPVFAMGPSGPMADPAMMSRSPEERQRALAAMQARRIQIEALRGRIK